MTQGFFQFNNSIINEIINFATSSFDLLYMSGPKGSAKSETIEKLTKELSKDYLIFQHFCFENTVIDDFLLNFYDALRNFSLAQKISLKKFMTNDFKEKISHYFKTINSKCIITVENFEKVNENIEIIDFLSHLADYENVKIIIVARNNNKNLFRFKPIKIKTLEISPISKEEFKSKLTVLGDTLDEEIKEKYYNITNGLELYLKMGIKYCATTGFSIKDLISEFERKNQSQNIDFEEFMVSKFVSLTPSAYQGLFRILTILSHPVSIDFLREYNLGNTSYADYLSKNFLVSRFRDEIYVKDYFKQYIVKTFSIQEKITNYKNLIAIYENELTKSPKDRLLRLSRESIRKEIDSFKALIPQINSSNKHFSYLGLPQTPWADEKEKQKLKLNEKLNKIKERKNFLSRENNIFSKNANLQKRTEEYKKEQEHNFIINLINSSRDYTKNYQYKEAIEELLRAKETDNDHEFKIEIYSLIAKNYEALNDFNVAQKYYSEALEYAIETRDSRKCELQFSIAMTNVRLFKTEIAKTQFIKIAANENNPTNYRANALIEYGEIEEAESKINNAIKAYNDALKLVLGKNKSIVSRAYFKLGLIYDENQDWENAIKYYQKNYTTSSEKSENKYYSLSLTNLALIYIEESKYRDAAEFLKLALLYDSENNDLNNMYFSQKELAKLYSRIDEQTAISYYKQALDSATKLNDDFKIALVYFEAGEYYYDKENDKKALENFLNAKKSLKANPKSENVARINSRIEDIKMRLDKITFDLIMEKYDNKS